jgi:hypothetical protein
MKPQPVKSLVSLPGRFVTIDPTPECYANIFNRTLPIWHLSLWKDADRPMRIRGSHEVKEWRVIVQGIDKSRHRYRGEMLITRTRKQEDYAWIVLAPEEEEEALRAFESFETLRRRATIPTYEQYLAEMKEKLCM